MRKRSNMKLVFPSHKERMRAVMAYKTILLHLDGGARDDMRLDIAMGLTAFDEAHLIVLRTIPYLANPAFGAYAIGAAAAIAQAEREYFESAEEEAERLRETIERRAQQEGVSLEWRLEKGYAEEILPVHARYADLTIMGQTDPDAEDAARARGVPVQTVTDSGRPLLVIPYAGDFKAPGRRPLIAWNGSREASRAVHDAMPFLKRADKVFVLSIDPPSHAHIAGFDISAHLARHGVNAEAKRNVSSDISAGDVLLSECADLGADMIVMGAYGHSRLREFILGGVSQHLLQTMTVPVFMSH
mgnify:CR=1 FL=1